MPSYTRAVACAYETDAWLAVASEPLLLFGEWMPSYTRVTAKSLVAFCRFP